MPEKSPSPEGEGQALESAIEMARRSHREIEPHNLPPEAVEALSTIMDEAIEAYERYKASNDIKDGQEALLLLEKYRDEFVRFKAEKASDQEGSIEPREYDPKEEFTIPLSKYATVSGAKIIDGSLYFFASDANDNSSYITDGLGYKLSTDLEVIQYPFEHDGQMLVLVGDNEEQKLIDNQGEVVWESNGTEKVNSVQSLNNKLVKVKQFSTSSLKIEAIGTDTSDDFTFGSLPGGTSRVDGIIKSGKEIYVSHGDSAISILGSSIAGEQDRQRKITSMIPYRDGVAYLRKRGSASWEVASLARRGGDQNIKRSHMGVDTSYADNLLITDDDTFILSVYKDGKQRVNVDGKTSQSLGEFGMVYEIKQIDEETIYVLGVQDNNLVKKVIRVDDLK